MWAEKQRRKHIYVQRGLKYININLIDEYVKKDFCNKEAIVKDRGLREAKFLNRDACYKVKPPVAKPGKIPRLAYGNRVLPKLILDIAGDNNYVKYDALCALQDVLKNPQECYQALSSFAIVKKLKIVLKHFIPESINNYKMFKAILENFDIIGRCLMGAWKMVAEEDLINTFYDLVLNKTCSTRAVLKILCNLSSHEEVVEALIHLNYVKAVFQIVRSAGEKHTEVFLHLYDFILKSPKLIMNVGFFETYICRMETRDKFQMVLMKCFAVLLTTKQARDYFNKIDGTRILYDLIKDKTYCEEMLEYITLALQNLTVSKHSLWRCREFWDLPLILIRLASTKTNNHLQLYALQTLRQITAMPSVKDFARKTLKRQIQAIICSVDYVEKRKEDLLKWLNKKNYKNIQIEEETKIEDEILGSEKDEEEVDTDIEEFCQGKFDAQKKALHKPESIIYRLNYGKIVDTGAIA